MSRKPSGNVNEAIELLKNTKLTYREVSDKTGVPYGTVGTLGGKHRPKAIREELKRKYAKEYIARKTATSGELFGNKNAEVAVAKGNKLINRNISFNYDTNGNKVSKSDFISEINAIINNVEGFGGESVTFKIQLEVK